MTSSHAVVLCRARWLVAALRVRTALLRTRLAVRAYNPGQPRVPAGNPDGGRWTDGDDGPSGSDRDDGQIIRVVDDGDRRYGVVLSEEETRGGHTLRKHVGKTDDEMLERIRASKQEFLFVTYGIRRVGSFDSAESANDFVNRTLEQNASEVDLVASGKRSDAFVKSRFGYKTGREGYTAGRLEPYMRNTYGVGVFIVHDPGSSKGYYVHSAYPRNDGD